MKKSLIVSLAAAVVVVAGGSATAWYAYNNKYSNPSTDSTKTTGKSDEAKSPINSKNATPPTANTTNPGSPTPAPSAQTPAPTPMHAPATDHAIAISASGFNPASLTVKKGTAVTWTNNDSAAHAIASSNGLHSPQLKSGESYTYTFTQAGIYPYEDVLVPGLNGTVTVTN